MPDHQRAASTNDLLVGRLIPPGQPGQEWRFDDEDASRDLPPGGLVAPPGTTWFG